MYTLGNFRESAMPLRLSKWQTNEIFGEIGRVGLNPKEFDLTNTDAEVCIKNKWSMSCFTVVPDPSHYVGRCVAGDNVDWIVSEYSWSSLIIRVGRWLEDVRIDLEMPDRWAELQKEAQLLSGATSNGDTENTSFSEDEQREIASLLKAQAEDGRRAYSLSAEQTQALNAKIEYLVDAAGRFGRKDWLNLCVGVIFTYFLTAALPPEAARGMFLGLWRALGHLYGLPTLPILP